LRTKFLDHEGFAEDGLKEFHKRAEIAVLRLDTENRRAAIAVERLDDDVLKFSAEGLDVSKRARDERWRHQVEEIEHEELFGRIADICRIVHDEGLRMNALEKVRRRNVSH